MKKIRLQHLLILLLAFALLAFTGNALASEGGTDSPSPEETPAPPTEVTITVTGTTVTYGNAPSLSSIIRIAPEEAASAISYTLTIDGKSYDSLFDVGSHAIHVEATADQGSYHVTVENGDGQNLTVNKATATLHIGNTSKDYDGQVPTDFNASWKEPLAESILGSQYTLTLIDAKADAGPYTFNLEVTAPEKDNFEITKDATTYSINQITVNPVIKLSATQVDYGNAKPTAELKWDNNADYVIDQIQAATASSEIIVPEVGSVDNQSREVTVTVTNQGNSNVAIGSTTAKASYTVNPRPVTLYVDGASKTYDGTPGDGSAVGYHWTDDFAKAELTSVTVTCTPGTNAGSYDATAVVNSDTTNFTITKEGETGAYKIEKRAATVTANNASKVYGGTDPELTATVTGAVDGETLDYTVTREGGEGAGDYAITVTLGSSAVNDNYNITPEAGKFTITQAGVSLKLTGYSREYNGAVPNTIDIGVNWGAEPPEGIGYELYFVDDPKADVGSYRVSARLTGEKSANYAINVSPVTYEVKPLTVTLKMPDDHKTYDGKEADVSKLKGEWSSDLAKNLAYTPTVEKNKNAGSYAIGATVAENGNFTVTVEKGTYTINPKAATITVKAKEKTYGDSDPAFEATVTGALAGEELKYTLTRGDGENVGKYSIKATATTDAVNKNYTINCEPANLTINQRAVTLTVKSETKVYGDDDPKFTATADNMAKGETLAYAISRVEGEKVGTYTITATPDEKSAVNKNYAIKAVTGTLTVTKRPVTLTAATLSKIYGEKDPALTASADNMAFTDQLQYTVKRATGENVGDYDITIELPKTAVEPNNNYTITTKAAKLTIKQRPVKLTAEAKTKVYGDKDPELTATTDNMANGEKLVYTLSRVEGEKVGTYTITATPDTKAAVNKNYAITPVTGVLTVTKRPVTLTATALSKIYGEKDPTLTATPDNMAFTDKLAYTLKRAEGENVGDYAITIELPKAATEPNNNYDIKLVAAKLTINQRPVKLTVEAKTKIYGEKDPEFTATTDNMVNDEKLVYTLSRTEGEKVGKYTITATPDAEAAVNKNYAITPVANTLTIDPLAIKLTVAESAKFYGQKDPTFTASAPTVYDDVLQYTFERDEGEAVGAYEVRVVPTADVEPNSNYTITPVAAKLTVSYLPHADAVISAPDENGWYNVKSGPITITAPEGYEISKTYDEGFGPSIVFEDSKVLETAKYTYVLRSVKTDGTADGQTEIVTGEYRQDTVPPTEFTVNNSSSVRFVPADNENGSGIVRSEYVQFKSSSEEVVDGRVLYQSTNLDEVRFQHPYAGGFRVVQWDAAGNCTVSNYITLPDSDGDRLNDYFEQDFKSDPKKQDTDGDGLNDSEEYTRGCNPNSSDSDGDGLTDGEEVSKGLNPTRTDTDSDGIPDGTAYLYEGKDADLSMGAEMVLGRGYSTETAVTTAKVPEVLEQYAMYGFIEEHASAELTGAQATRSVGNKVKPVVYMNRASGHVITLTGDILSVYVQNNYRFNAETTLQLNYLAEGETATALVSNDGQVAAIAKWENGVAAEDILLVDIAAGKTYLVSDSAGATLFDLRADGTELAYVKDGQLTTLTLGKEDDMHVQAYSGNALQYLEDGSLAVNINVESWKADVLANGQMKTVDFSGYYYLGNRALGSVQLIMRAEGQNVEIEMSGNVVLSSQDTLIRFVNSEQKYKALITANQFTK